MPKITHLPTHSDLDTTSKRLKYVIEQTGIKQSHIAKKLGVSRGAVHYVLNSDVKNSKSVKKIADILGVDAHWIETGKTSPAHIPDTTPHAVAALTTGAPVPVYYFDQLLLREQNKDAILVPIASVLAQRSYTERLFAVQLSKPSPLQKFESGEIILLTEQTSCSAGDWILAYHAEEASLFFGLVLLHDQDTLALLHHKTENLLTLQLKIDRVMGVFAESIKYAKL